MNIYAAIESVVVAVMALVSVFYVLKLVVPGPMQSIRRRVADRLGRLAGHNRSLRSLADRLRVDGSSGGCATGCESGGCNGCHVASRAAMLSGRDGADHA
jgi:hypothetical protein